MNANPQDSTRQPIQSPADWSVADLEAQPTWRHDFDPKHGAELAKCVRELAGAIPDEQQDRFEISAASLSGLPGLDSALNQASHLMEQGPGLFWLRGLPLDSLSERETRILFWCVGLRLGRPLPQTADGAMLFDVRDQRLPENHPKARGPSSSKSLSFHSDRCDVIGFLCLQPAAEGGENEVVSSVRLHNELLNDAPDLLETLFQPYRYERHNIDLGNEMPYYEQPIFAVEQGHFSGFLMRVLIERAYAQPDSPAMSQMQRDALDKLAELAAGDEWCLKFRQERGDLFFVNNLVTLHRRTAFKDRADAAKRRHLLRLWLSTPHSRPLPASFAPTFGSTAPGTLRGGMRQLSASKSSTESTWRTKLN